MAAKNHVRAFVHSTGVTMTWALGYYKAFRFEISKSPADDMVLDDIIDLGAGNATVTFVDVLKSILGAVTAGFSEVMIVAHGSPKGLIMPIAPGLSSADKDNLPLMTELAGVIAERDRIRAISDAQQSLAEWIKLLTRLAGAAIGNATWGPITPIQLNEIKSGAEAEQWLITTAPTLLSTGKSILKNATALQVLDLRNQVAKKKLKRVEVRACNLGGDIAGMRALREFLGADRVLAPMVKTFYGHVRPTLFTKAADYNKWLAVNVPWTLKGQPDPPHNRAYVGRSGYLTPTSTNFTPMAVLKLTQPNLQTCAGMSGNANHYSSMIFLVNDNIDVKQTSGYATGAFFLGGLDPEAGRTTANPAPPAAKGKAFLLASEPEYRDMIVSNP